MTETPKDLEAEQAVLGACLLSVSAYHEARSVLSDDDWHWPAHQVIWATIADLARRRVQVDAVVVADELHRSGDLQKVGGRSYLHTLIAGVPTVANVGYYAGIVAEKAVLRWLLAAGQRIQQIAVGADTGEGMDGATGDAVARAQAEIALVVKAARSGADAGSAVDVHDLIAETLPERMVLPGLLAEGERFLLTAAEGIGKTTLLRQLAVCAAAGLHPFSQEPTAPVRALVVDCENGRRLSQNRYAALVAQARRVGHPVAQGMLQLDIRPRGIDLLQPGAARALLQQVERLQPQLVMIGPVYRLHEDDPNDERTARKITVVLDQIREIGGAAIVTEAHMAKAVGIGGERSAKPVGSGLWMRWPDYGYGLVLAPDSDLVVRSCRLKAWRGPRDERDWPERLQSGLATGKPWPWVRQNPFPAEYWEPAADGF